MIIKKNSVFSIFAFIFCLFILSCSSSSNYMQVDNGQYEVVRPVKTQIINRPLKPGQSGNMWIDYSYGTSEEFDFGALKGKYKNSHDKELESKDANIIYQFDQNEYSIGLGYNIKSSNIALGTGFAMSPTPLIYGTLAFSFDYLSFGLNGVLSTHYLVSSYNGEAIWKESIGLSGSDNAKGSFNENNKKQIVRNQTLNGFACIHLNKFGLSYTYSIMYPYRSRLDANVETMYSGSQDLPFRTTFEFPLIYMNSFGIIYHLNKKLTGSVDYGRVFERTSNNHFSEISLQLSYNFSSSTFEDAQNKSTHPNTTQN